MRKLKLISIGLVLAFILLSCTTTPTAPWSARSPKDKALTFLEIYNTQYDDTMSMAKMPDLTEGQKEVVRTKKVLLTKRSGYTKPAAGAGYEVMASAMSEAVSDLSLEISKAIVSVR